MRVSLVSFLLLPLVCFAGTPAIRPGNVLEERSVSVQARSADLNLARAIEQVPGVVADEEVGASCSELLTPSPISTPAPALNSVGRHGAIRVNFVITTDGLIDNPVVVLSAGPRLDRIVTRAISRWKYRPASCNGVPIQAEASIEFPAK
jgi:TonB family protein